MKLTVKKTLLASLVLFGLTACGSSGGGSGSSAPTTKANTNQNETITVPNIADNSSDTSTPTIAKPNQPAPTPNLTSSTFKVGSDGYATGKATYASATSSIVLNADFDKREISGSAVGKLDNQNVNVALNNTTLYKSSVRYINGMYSNYDESYEFKGNATAEHNKEKFTGEYSGAIYGNSSPFSDMTVGYIIKSENNPQRIIKEAGCRYINDCQKNIFNYRSNSGYVTVGSNLNKQ